MNKIVLLLPLFFSMAYASNFECVGVVRPLDILQLQTAIGQVDYGGNCFIYKNKIIDSVIRKSKFFDLTNEKYFLSQSELFDIIEPSLLEGANCYFISIRNKRNGNCCGYQINYKLVPGGVKKTETFSRSGC
jgi:hypothetical protein